MVCRMDALSGGTSSLQNEARKLNHAEVVEEDRRNKLPANWEARKRKAEWEAMEEEARKVEMALVHSPSTYFPLCSVNAASTLSYYTSIATLCPHSSCCTPLPPPHPPSPFRPSTTPSLLSILRKLRRQARTMNM